MPPSYPGLIKSFSALTDGVDQIVAAHPNERGDEIEAIETELGTNPADKTGGIAATYATVKARLDKTHRAATLVVAASDASLDSRQFADYLCDGTADDVQIQAAVDALPAGGGEVLLTEGTFVLASQVLRAINNVNISGSGRGTRLNLNGSTAVISVGSQAGWTLLRFDTDAGGIDVASASEFRLDYWKNGARDVQGLAHADLDDAPADAHHAKNHASRHAIGGADQTKAIQILDRDLTTQDVVNTVVEASIYSFEIPAGVLGSDGGFKLMLSGELLINDGSGIGLTIRVKLGATTVLTTSSAVWSDQANRRRFRLEILCMNSAVDAQRWSAEFVGVQEAASFAGAQGDAGSTMHMVGSNRSGTENTSGALTFDVTIQWSGANVNNSFRKEMALLELLPAV